MAGKLDDLDARLHEEAAQAAGSDDFGDDYYREGFRRLLSELDRVTGGGEALATAARFNAGELLVGRLYSQRGWKARPNSLATAIDSPVVIIGIPRTGTTMMHKFLSMHDGFQVLERWLVSYPMVRPPRERWPSYREYRLEAGDVDSRPERWNAMHFVAADEPDECLKLVDQSFVSSRFGASLLLPAYDEWMLAEDKTPALRRHADNLRLIGADEPRRWLLKNPSYVLCMREFLTVFPDAKVVWMHRDPQRAVGSLSDLLLTKYGGDPQARATRELHLWSEGVQRTHDARSGHEDAFFDVDYRRLVADPLGVSSALFEWLGIDVGAETKTRMRSWHEQNPQGKHGAHQYDPAELGVADAAVRELFAPYLERYRELTTTSTSP